MASSIKIVAPNPHETLYHGSSRLYRIQCFILKNGPLLDPYLQHLHSSNFIEASEQEYTEQAQKIQGYIKHFLGRLPVNRIGDGSLNEHVLYLLTLEKLSQTSEGSSMRVSRVLELAQAKDREYAFETRTLDDLLKFSMQVEACRNADELTSKGLFDVSFYSVMKSPVQFFGTRETALSYASNSDEFLYGYDFSPEAHNFLDIDDLGTVKELMTQPGMPFFSGEIYSKGDIEYYTQRVGRHVREMAIFGTLNSLPELPPSETALGYIELPIRRPYNPQKINRDWMGEKLGPLSEQELQLPELLQGDTLRTVLMKFFEQLYQESRESWILLCEVLKLDLTTGAESLQLQLVDAALLKFPVLNSKTRDDVFKWVDRATRDHRLVKAKIVYHRKYIIPYLKKAIRLFNGNQACVQLLGDLLSYEYVATQGSISGSASAVGYSLREKWSVYFDLEIVSPRGLWVTLNWDKLQSDSTGQEKRISQYELDSLVVFSLVSSPWFQNSGLRGWRCQTMGEWMVYRPELSGKMRKVQSGFNLQDSKKCTPENYGIY